MTIPRLKKIEKADQYPTVRALFPMKKGEAEILLHLLLTKLSEKKIFCIQTEIHW